MKTNKFEGIRTTASDTESRSNGRFALWVLLGIGEALGASFLGAHALIDRDPGSGALAALGILLSLDSFRRAGHS